MSWKCKHCGEVDLFEIEVSGAVIANFDKNGKAKFDSSDFEEIEILNVVCCGCLRSAEKITDLAVMVDE